MPDDPSPRDRRPHSRPRLPFGLLGMIVLVILVESFVMGHDDDLTTFVASNWETNGRTVAKLAGRNQILCFGDSMVKFGIQPSVLQSRLNKTTYNFALYCGSAPSSYFLLRRSLDSGATPEAIVVDFPPELMMSDSINNLARVYPELLTWRETLEFCGAARDLDRLAEFVLAKVFPSVRKRYEIRAGVLASIRGESTSPREKLLASRRNWSIHKGAEVLPKNPYYPGDVPESGAYSAMFRTPWKANHLHDRYLRRFLRLAASKDVPVFWVIQPNAASVDARREKIGYNAQYEAYVRAYLEKFPNLVVIDGRHVNYPHQVFFDPVHLDSQGATACSLGVAEVLRSHLFEHQAGPRWVLLPDHTAEMTTFRLEDNAESAIVLQADQSKVRR